MYSMLIYCPSVLSSNRIKRYKAFKDFQERICVATDVFGRGIDIERINLAINYDLPADADSYLHRVGRAGRFGTKGLSISFVSSEADEEVLKSVEKRFEADIPYVVTSLRLLCTLLTTFTGHSLLRVSTPASTWQTRDPWIFSIVRLVSDSALGRTPKLYFPLFRSSSFFCP